jgi:uncharacterized protein YbjT (DUF2867 family)
MMSTQDPILVLGGTGHYGRHIVRSLLKREEPVPQDIAAQVPTDHQRLIDTFDYQATTLEMEAQRRAQQNEPLVNKS